MNCFYVISLALAVLGAAVGDVNVDTAVSSSTRPEPIYSPQENPSRYVPHATYPYADVYGPISPYEGYAYPSMGYPLPSTPYTMSSLMPTAQGALQIGLRLLSKVGLFLIGATAFLLVGGLFTSAVCSWTPICTLTFNGVGNIDKDTMRAFMTPEKISAAATLVQDAIGRYQRLQQRPGNQ